MKCLLCGLNCSTEKVIKKHVNFHQIKEDDIFFKDLFLPDTLEKNVTFVTYFLKHADKIRYICFFSIMVLKNSLVQAKEVHYRLIF